MSQEEIKNEEGTEDIQKALQEKEAVIQELQGQTSSMKAKMDELLNEAKKAKQKARDEAEAKERAEIEKAKKNGDFEQLLKSSEKERQTLSEQLQELRSRVSSEKVNSEAMRIAAELADGYNAEILKPFIAQKLKYTEEGIRVLNDHGELTVSTLDDLKNLVISDPKFKAVLRGNQSSGGGAAGSGSSASAESIITRAQFNEMNSEQRMKFIKQGGKIEK